MGIVRVWGNTYLNPKQVGKLTEDISFEDEGKMRVRVTEVFDLTGKNLLLRAKTEVHVDPSNSDRHSVERDNFFHDQIKRAINDEVDAKQWTDPKS